MADNTLIPEYSKATISSDYINTSGYVPYNPDSITPVRSNEFTGGVPTHAYFQIKVGGKTLRYSNSNAPSITQMFEINRLDDAGCTATFTIFDDNWDEIEKYLADHWNNISISYGYNNGISSDEYKMILLDYSIDFSNTGVMLSIKAISEGVIENINPVGHHDTGTKNPTEAIKSICRFMNWHVDDRNFAPTLDVDREETYKILEDNPVTYIMDCIIPEALSTNKEILGFYLDADEKKTAHLILKSCEVSGSSSNHNLADVPTYIYQKGYDSVVQSLTFNINGVFGGTDFESGKGVATGLEGSVINPLDKSEGHSKEDPSTVLTASTGKYSHTRSGQSIPRWGTSGETLNQLQNKLYYYVKNATNSQYEATMTILGDPSLQLFKDVRIINLTDFGDLHHTSGIYFIKGIVDSIENGEFRTVVQLQRNGDINEGVELLNPKTHIK